MVIILVGSGLGDKSVDEGGDWGVYFLRKCVLVHWQPAQLSGFLLVTIIN